MMTDEARIARLTQLARRVWPEQPVEVACMPADHLAIVRLFWPNEQGNGWSEPLHVQHPRALDALEAALLVLAGYYPNIADGADVAHHYEDGVRWAGPIPMPEEPCE